MSAAAADDVLRARELTAEEVDLWRRRTGAMESELQEKLRAELDVSKNAEVKVTETWRKVLRLAKVSTDCCCGAAGWHFLDPAPPFFFSSVLDPQPLSPPHPHSQTNQKTCGTPQMTTLHEDVVAASAAYDRDLERADQRISMALAAMAEGDAQRARAVANHLRGLDRAVEVHEGRVADLDVEYAREVRALDAEFSVERDLLVSRHATFRKELLHTIEAIREAEEGHVADEQADFDQAREALRRNALERLNALQSDMDTRVERAETAFEEAHINYINATGRRTVEFKALLERTEADALLAERQQRAMARMTRLLQVWRSRLLNAKRDTKERNEGLYNESSNMSSAVERLKADIMRNRSAHMLRLKTLSAAAALVKGNLAAALSKAEKLCASAEAARVHETLGEKVDPFALGRGEAGAEGGGTGLLAVAGTQGAALLAGLRREGGSGLVPTSGTEAGAGAGMEGEAVLAVELGLPPELLCPGTGPAVEEAARLAPFYSRFNKALMDTLVLQRRRDRLRAEHAELSGALQQVEDGLELAPGALDGVNSLMVLNGRAAVEGPGGTALAPNRAAVTESFLASGPPPPGAGAGAAGSGGGGGHFPVRLAGPTVAPVRPGAPGVATVVVEGNTVVNQRAMLGHRR